MGLITNVTGASRDRTRTIDLLRDAPGVKLVALFAPEHGLSTDRDQRISNGTDPASHLPVYSLYGDVFEPTPAMLEGIDTLVFDIQDAGARFYTYASTLHRVLRVGGGRGLRVVVLDRPNPIGGTEVSGPLVTADAISFVNHHPLPVRHGMTLGEIAGMIDADEHLGVDLDIVRMTTGIARNTSTRPAFRGCHHRPTSDRCGRRCSIQVWPWSKGPMSRSAGAPTRLSRSLGAPWVDGAELASALEEVKLAGVVFEAAEFTPKASAYAGQRCRGVEIDVEKPRHFRAGTNRHRHRPRPAALYPDAWHPDKMNQISATPQ